MGWTMTPWEYHLLTLQEMTEDKYGEKETPKNEKYWNTYWWFNESTKATIACIRELLQYCNNAEVAEKAWLLLDKMEVGE